MYSVIEFDDFLRLKGNTVEKLATPQPSTTSEVFREATKLESPAVRCSYTGVKPLTGISTRHKRSSSILTWVKN